jgi:DNA processing protein
MTRVPDVLDPADTSPRESRALRDWLDLQRSLHLHPQDVSDLLGRSADARSALRALPGALPSTPDALDAAVAALRLVGAVAVPFGSASYPPALGNLSDPAPLLLVRGEVAALAGPSVAIVGSRAATAYGRAVARRLAADLAAEGLVVVSGLALGIDAEAHRGALEAGGRTVAFLACGPDLVYPRIHRQLAEEIARRGALVSEFPPGTPPRPPHFPLRNRLISGVSSVVVVVEARDRSGSLITARHAADQGRDVYAVPGPISAPTSAGPNRLIRDGAGIVLGAAELLEELRRSGALPGRPAPRRGALGRSREGAHRRFDGERGRILEALLHEPSTRDQLARRLERAPEQLAFDLLELEMEGSVAEDRDGRLRVVSL